jgi:GDP-4-dehydro-6-deoxy-D-mannose reductase
MSGPQETQQRAFITGGNGFVGKYLQEHLLSCGDVLAAPFVEITDRNALTEHLSEFCPTTIYHLAGQANVGLSWGDPASTFTTNALGTLQLCEAAAALKEKPTVVVVSSAEVYGVVRVDEGPINESRVAAPTTPYGSSKLAAEIVAQQIGRAHDIAIAVARPFNHIGPGQSESFVVSGVARRIAEAELAGADQITIGNLDSIRDFTDVRDVVIAYRLLAQGKSAGVYNIGSGVGRSIRDLVDGLVAHAHRPLALVSDPKFMRPSDVPRLVCDASLLNAHTNWRPLVDIEESLAGTLNYWREQLAK